MQVLIILLKKLIRNRCSIIVIGLIAVSVIAIQLKKQSPSNYTADLFKMNYRNMFIDNYDDYEFTTNKSFILNRKSYLMKSNVNIFNLSAPLEPSELYESIVCKNSLIYIVRTTLCVHDVKVDMHVSGTILSRGAWEQHILMPFLDMLDKNPDWLVIDIGAHIGQYSLFAAKMGHHVISVEPFSDNILRIHKAATYEHLQDKITLVKNAVSNKRNELKLLHKVSSNIGGQGLLENKHKKILKKTLKNSNDLDKYLVETILMDDLLNYIPLINSSNSTTIKYKKALLKIDIEGFEPFAFLNSRLLFKELDIRVIIMEWGSFAHRVELFGLIRKMILFLTSLSYYPYDFNVALSTRNWLKWPWDVIWKKID